MPLILQRRLTIAALTILVGLGVVTSSVSIFAASPQQSTLNQRPRFKNYPADAVFKDTPATPIANTEELKNYEEALKAAAKKGTNFAGHYAIADHLNRAMGGVDTAAIIDLQTGKVYLPPQLQGYHDQRGAGYTPPRPDGGLRYRANSKLLIIIGEAAGKDGQKGVGRFYYKWDNNQLQFLYFISSPYKSQ